jgi:hypothetical protein
MTVEKKTPEKQVTRQQKQVPGTGIQVFNNLQDTKGEVDLTKM